MGQKERLINRHLALPSCLGHWLCVIACSAHFLLCHAFVHLASVPMFPNVLSSSLCLHHITPSAQTHTTLNKPACCALHNWAGVVVRCVACSCILFIFQTTNTTSITQTTASTTHLTTLLLSLSSAPILPANTEWLSNPWRTCSVQSN